MAPAKTGKESNNNKEVIIMLQRIKGRFQIFILGTYILIIVVIKLIEDKIEETLAKCKEKIAASTCKPECLILLLRGG